HGGFTVLRPRVRCLCLAGIAEHGEHSADGGGFTLLDADFRERAGVLGFELHIRLVGFDLRQHFALLDMFADTLEPAKDRPLFHRVAQLRHGDLDRHTSILRGGYYTEYGGLPRPVGMRGLTAS